MKKPAYFALPFYQDRYVVGRHNSHWLWFYDCFVEGKDNINAIDLSSTPVRLLNYQDDASHLGDIMYLAESQIAAGPKSVGPAQMEVFFDEAENQFMAKKDATTGPATDEESLLYADLIASKNMPLAALRMRLLEMYHGFVPSHQYAIEQTYLSFFHRHRQSIDTKDEAFTAKARKLAFDSLFDTAILPFAQAHGFGRHTKTSNRLYKPLGNGLSVFVFFEHKSFGYGAYEVSVVYFDEDMGLHVDDMYLARIAPNFPFSSNLMIDSHNTAVLAFDTHYWMRVMGLYMMPFIARHGSHAAIWRTIENKEALDKARAELGVDSLARKPVYFFDLPPADRGAACLQLIREKAKLTDG